MEDKELKIFELRWTSQGEKEWVCAYTNINALVTYLCITDTDMADLDYQDEIIEIPRNKWPEMSIRTDQKDGIEKTFEEYMKTATIPDIIATTIY